MEGALGAITGLVGAGLQYSAQQTANVINMMNLQFQKQNAAKQLKFAQAGKQDQYGNETKFDQGLNEWVMNLTPTQRAIASAQEKEQYLTLTEDAQRNRAIKEQQRARGLEAAPEFNRVMADWKFNQPRSELSTRDELTNLLAGVANEKANKSKTDLIREALRQGQGGSIGTIIKDVNDDTGTTLAETMLKARAGAASEYAERVNQHNQTDLPIIAQLQQLMDMGGSDGGGGAGGFNPGAALGAMQTQGTNAMQAALKSGGAGVGAAYKALAASEGKSPNLAGIAKGLGGGKGGGQQGQTSDQPQYSMMGSGDDPYGLSGINIDRFTNSYGDF